MLHVPRLLIAAVVVIVAGAAIAGCRGGRPSEPVPAVVTDGDAGQTVGGSGTICRLGQMSQDPTREAHECNPGLSCCYPCGIAGCDSVCMEDCGPPRP